MRWITRRLSWLPRHLVIALGLGGALACVASPSIAELLAYDPFLIGTNPAAGEYTVGPLDPGAGAEDGQNPTIGPTPFFAGPWVRQDDSPNGAVQETGLAYLGAPAPGSSQLSTPNSRSRRFLATPWTATTVGTFYIGYFVNFGQGDYTDGVSGNDMGYRSTEFWNADGGFAMGVAYNTFSSTIGPQQQNPATARMYLDLNGHQIIAGSPDSFMEDGLTHLIVLRFNLSDQAASDSVALYLDPKDMVEPVIPSALVSGIDFTLGALGGVSIFGGSGTFPAYDELRVCTDYACVLPEFPVPGDTNGDDQVDELDYQAIISHMNLSGQSLADGDVTGDGRVTIADYRFWKERRTDLSSGAGTASQSAVPESASLWLATAAAAAVIGCGRWHTPQPVSATACTTNCPKIGLKPQHRIHP